MGLTTIRLIGLFLPFRHILQTGCLRTLGDQAMEDDTPAHYDWAEGRKKHYVVEGEIEVKSELGNYTAAGSSIGIPKGGVDHNTLILSLKT